MNKKIITVVAAAALLVVPAVIFADTTTTPVTTTPPAQMGCINLTVNLKMGSSADPATKLQILNLQLAMANEGFTIDSAESGTYGPSTKAAVKAFQEKYHDDILAPFGYTKGTGNVGTLTRLKLAALYGCRTNMNAASGYTGSVNLSVNNLVLNGDGVSATFCNNGKTDLPVAPFRIRLNGINRDFEEVGARPAGACVTDSWLYSTWGLSFDPGSTIGAVTLIDPNGLYKQGQIKYPLNGTATITVPALTGTQLAVRSVGLKTTGLQATFCNVGTLDVTSFPVQVTLNGTAKMFDIPEVYKSGKCQTKNWTYDNWGLTYTPGTSYSATVIVDPNGVYSKQNEFNFDNVASVIGMP